MVRMVSTDGNKVVLEDFKKIGKGKIIPLGGVKVPDQNTKTKQTILNNIKNSTISAHDPNLVSRLQPTELSFAQFQ